MGKKRIVMIDCRHVLHVLRKLSDKRRGDAKKAIGCAVDHAYSIFSAIPNGYGYLNRSHILGFTIGYIAWAGRFEVCFLYEDPQPLDDHQGWLITADKRRLICLPSRADGPAARIDTDATSDDPGAGSDDFLLAVAHRKRKIRVELSAVSKSLLTLTAAERAKMLTAICRLCDRLYRQFSDVPKGWSYASTEYVGAGVIAFEACDDLFVVRHFCVGAPGFGLAMFSGCGVPDI